MEDPLARHREALFALLRLAARPMAFLCSGQMAAAYFMAHAPRGFWPIQNGGELAVLYCFFFLFVAARGAGVWSLDSMVLGSGHRSVLPSPRAPA